MALCASGAEKTNRFPWKEIMFGLHLRRPHKADQSHFCRGEGGEEERIWTATHSCTVKHAQHCQAGRRSEMLRTKRWLKATHDPVIVILFGPRQNLRLGFRVLRLSWGNVAIRSGFQAATRPSTTLAGWRTGCRALSTRGGRGGIQC